MSKSFTTVTHRFIALPNNPLFHSRSFIKHLCAITADFKSKSIWQRLTKLGVPRDISRCTHLLNSQPGMK